MIISFKKSLLPIRRYVLLKLRMSAIASPQPGWKPGDAQPHPFGDDAKHISIDPNEESNGVYGLMISSITPRPVALVSTHSADHIPNLAPFSYFGMVSHDPPTIMLGIGIKHQGDKGGKDTINNIEETSEFVVNIVSDWMVESASHCAGDFAEDVNEMEITGLTPIPSETVGPSRVKESAVNYECQVNSTQKIYNDKGQHTTTMVIARVVKIHVIEPLLKGKGEGRDGSNNYRVDFQNYRPLGRLGGNTWAHIGDTFDIARPRISK
jgi:flavin reductase (DIM6/NTAB) family NADH-FMN oxidoreductase RutF